MEDRDPFSENWPSFTPATKPTEYHPASGFSLNILSQLFFDIMQERDDLALNKCSFFGSDPQMGREHQESSHVCSARCH